MSGIYSRHSTISDYATLHLNSLQTATPVGKVVGTTSSTAVTGGASTTVTVASAANIEIGMILTICGGTGTQEDVQVTAVNTSGNTFTAFFANNHSGTWTAASRRKTAVGPFIVGTVGTGITVTLYDGHPSANYSKVISAIAPVAGGLPFACVAQYGLYVTVAGTTAGDYTVQYVDVVAQ